MDRGTGEKSNDRRDEKRERFSVKASPIRRKNWILWGAVAAVLLVGGALGAWILLPGPAEPGIEVPNGITGADSPENAGTLAENANEAGPDESANEPGSLAEVESVVAVAATSGHAAYPLAVSRDGATVRFLASDFDDGMAQHFTYMYGDLPIEFFVLESRDGVVRAAFNACDVCYGAKRGYLQSGDLMVCVNCGRRFASNRINVVKGGCNPAPLDRRIEGEYVVIDVEDIVRGYRFF